MTQIGSVDATRVQGDILHAAAQLDGQAVRELLLEALLVGGVDATVADVMVPVLHAVGARWEQGDFGVMHEHFVSSAFTSALADVRLPVPLGAPTAVLACPPHELHDLPGDLFAAMLSARGWRAVTLGANTPMRALSDVTQLLNPQALILSAIRPRAFASRAGGLRRLAHRTPVYLAGEAASALDEPIPGVTVLPDDWRAAAELVTSSHDGRVPNAS